MSVVSDIEAALDHASLRARTLTPLSRSEPGKGGRAAFRVELDDGATIKARWLESAAAVDRLVALRANLESAFSPVLAQHGCVVLEAWVEGSAFSAEQDVAAAGALLGRLHRTGIEGGPRRIDTRAWRDMATARLRGLVGGGALAAPTAARLAAQLVRDCPGEAAATLIHRDFCPENLLLDAAGRLHVIDNEWHTVGPAGFDLGYTFSRWPMDAPVRERFLRAYRATGCPDPGPLAFWKIVAVLWRTRLPKHRRPGRLEPLIRQLAGGDSGGAAG